MTRHHGKSPLIGTVINARRLTLTMLVIAISGAITSPPASANASVVRQESMAFPSNGHDHRGDGNGRTGRINMWGGNGRNNKNDWAVFSPNIIRGPQAMSHTNFGGQTNTQAAFCKRRHRVCKISQWLRTHR
jgi:hypothetical protein